MEELKNRAWALLTAAILLPVAAAVVAYVVWKQWTDPYTITMFADGFEDDERN
jgi:hypothetical protein